MDGMGWDGCRQTAHHHTHRKELLIHPSIHPMALQSRTWRIDSTDNMSRHFSSISSVYIHTYIDTRHIYLHDRHHISLIT
mmetsp:Transcript_27095/g.67530  ORF Transcript_27095/g.67530 Transcript_27095/m.67530 type:complete len:80 (+) Transcript_27095:379-618(+)